jgi:hypothetical protein
MDDGAVGGAVVGQHALDDDAVAREEGSGAAQEGDGGGRFLVTKHLGVGESAVVVDRDVDVFPADGRAAMPVFVGEGWLVVVAAAADPFPGATLDPAELLDVDVHELARP